MSEYNYNDGEVELMAAEMLSVEMKCDYCKGVISIEEKDIIFVNGNAAHGTCAVKAGDVD